MLHRSLQKLIVFILVCCLEFKQGSPQGFIEQVLTPLSEIADNIREQRYALAQEQIVKLKDNSKIAEIIHDVYEQIKDDPFIEIMKFESEVTRVDVSYFVLEALRNEMVAHNNRDPLDLVPLAKALEGHVLFQQNKDEIIEAGAKKIISEIKMDVRNSSIEILSEALLTNNYLGNSKVEATAKEIFNFFYDLDDEILREVVNRTYSRIPAIEIIDVITVTSDYIPQKISVILAVFEKLEKDNDLDNEAILQIATSTKLLRDEKNYANLFPNQKYEVNLMIDKLPACARNAIFAEEVCLWNRGKEEYLYPQRTKNPSPEETITYTTEPDLLKTGDAAWLVERFFGDFRFKSGFYKKLFLSMSTQKPNRLTHYIETRVLPKNNEDDRSIWRVELDGDYCFLKNQNNEEYMFASDAMDPGKRRFALGAEASAVKMTNPDNFRWQIRDCS